MEPPLSRRASAVSAVSGAGILFPAVVLGPPQGSYTRLWEWASLCVVSLASVTLQLKRSMGAACVLYPSYLRDLPFDPTGQLDSLRSFIQANVDVFKWVGISVVIMQALSLLFAMVLRALVSAHQRVDHDIEEDYDDSGRIREPLLNSHSGQTSGLVKGDGKGAHSDIWSSRMREKCSLVESVPGPKSIYQSFPVKYVLLCSVTLVPTTTNFLLIPIALVDILVRQCMKDFGSIVILFMQYGLNGGDAKHNILNQT
ncbi:hypothetical protein RJ639_035000 [Escallonia herrerae]|uniref:Uncharacterized protein n=1 Tax=Escallonia herrerae TaxID=1293975 RepID=A0AA89B8H8_9ASTE|nr:hypothetical protein RJ639_035000 [Escallonia herrerae]